VVTNPVAKDVVTTQRYVCVINSRRHIDVCALEGGYVQEIRVKEGQAVKQGEVMFKILPTLYQAKLDAELAEAKLAQIEFDNTKKLFESKPPVVSVQQLALARAKLDKANANAQLAQAELDFTEIKAPFDGIIDRLLEMQGSLVEEGDMLTTMYDNSVMWVYFNVPEARYLEYMSDRRAPQPPSEPGALPLQSPLQPQDQAQPQNQAPFDGGGEGEQEDDHDRSEAEEDQSQNGQNVGPKTVDLQIELQLADGSKFPYAGQIGAIEAKFNNENGNIAFRADYPNPDLLLRHGQTGNVLLHRTVKGALVIPQRATFEILDKQYVYVIDDEGVVHQRPIEVEHELEDIFIVKGIDANEKIVLEGIRQVRDGEKVEYEFQEPDKALSNLKYHAE
jgi:membrane fusion protein (multidrug efflux system)